MDRDIIKEKIRVELEKFKVFFSASALLIGGGLGLILKVQLDIREQVILYIGVFILVILALLAILAHNQIDRLFRKLGGNIYV